MSRAYTEDEVREQVLNHFCDLISYWNGEADSNVPAHMPTRYRMEGLVHSILTTLDGCTQLPAFHISVQTHESDKSFYQERGENWYEEGLIISDKPLHEFWHEALKKKN